MLLNDRQIQQLCTESQMITPFLPEQDRGTSEVPKISSGLTSFGYDVRLGNEFKAYTSPYSVHQTPDKWGTVVDPLNFDQETLLESFTVDDEFVLLPPKGYFLACTVETIKMPQNVNAILLTKSTYARAGVFLNTTPIEAGWEGIITLEIANLTDRSVKLYINQGIGQLQFFSGERPLVTYADRAGKYMGQVGVVPPRG